MPIRGAEPLQLQMMYKDSLTYLPGDILCKLHRAAMAASLETRVPFLDRRVAEVAWRLPLHMKIRNGRGKWALRQVLHKYVPRNWSIARRRASAFPSASGCVGHYGAGRKPCWTPLGLSGKDI